MPENYPDDLPQSRLNIMQARSRISNLDLFAKSWIINELYNQWTICIID